MGINPHFQGSFFYIYRELTSCVKKVPILVGKNPIFDFDGQNC